MLKLISIITVFILVMSSSRAETALEALNTLSKNNAPGHANLVISIVGKQGAPMPQSWALLAYDRQVQGRLVHTDVARGRIIRTFALSAGDSKKNYRRPLDARRVRVDSDQIFDQTEKQARSIGVNFDSINYLLIYDEQLKQPIYKVDVIRDSVGVVGEALFSAVTGKRIYGRWSTPKIDLRPLPNARPPVRIVRPAAVPQTRSVTRVTNRQAQPRYGYAVAPNAGFLGGVR